MLGQAVDSGECDRCIEEFDYTICQLSQPEIRIRDLAQIYARAYQNYPEYADTGGRDIQGYLEDLWEKCPDGFLVAENKGEILGFIVVDKCYRIHKGKPVGEIQEIVVDGRHQGRKIGPRLLDAGIRRLESSGLQKIGLWVGKHNKPAQALYDKYGFRSIYTVHQWVRMERRGKLPRGITASLDRYKPKQHNLAAS
ncbi:MAG: GNAT family N-acetyltransferase [Bacillota bacterium]